MKEGSYREHNQWEMKGDTVGKGSRRGEISAGWGVRAVHIMLGVIEGPENWLLGFIRFLWLCGQPAACGGPKWQNARAGVSISPGAQWLREPLARRAAAKAGGDAHRGTTRTLPHSSQTPGVQRCFFCCRWLIMPARLPKERLQSSQRQSGWGSTCRRGGRGGVGSDGW